MSLRSGTEYATVPHADIKTEEDGPFSVGLTSGRKKKFLDNFQNGSQRKKNRAGILFAEGFFKPENEEESQKKTTKNGYETRF